MFKLQDIRKSRVWQEAKEEGREEGREEERSRQQRSLVRKMIHKGMKPKEISALIDLPLEKVRRLARQSAAE